MSKKNLPPVATIRELSRFLGMSSLVYRRNYASRKDHPAPLFLDVQPWRYRTAEVFQYLGLDASERSVGWLANDVAEWINNQIQASRGGES